MGKREAMRMAKRLCGWMNAHGRREPKMDSKDKVERELAEWLCEMRVAKAMHDLK